MTQDLLSGAIIMGYAIAAVHFFKFFDRTRDRLFQLFAIAFVVLAAQRLALALLAADRDAHIYLYGARVFAFLLILYAIIDKNREARPA